MSTHITPSAICIKRVRMARVYTGGIHTVWVQCAQCDRAHGLITHTGQGAVRVGSSGDDDDGHGDDEHVPGNHRTDPKPGRKPVTGEATNPSQTDLPRQRRQERPGDEEDSPDRGEILSEARPEDERSEVHDGERIDQSESEELRVRSGIVGPSREIDIR